MSRLPRHQEHLKTGFTAEAVSAAQYRAYAEQADTEGLKNLAAEWRRLAEGKDRLAAARLRTAGRVLSEDRNLADAVALERYENEVLYPRLIGDTGDAAAAVLEEVLEAQKETLSRLEEVRSGLIASRGDLPAPT